MIIKLYANHTDIQAFIEKHESFIGKAIPDPTGYYNTEILIDTETVRIAEPLTVDNAFSISPLGAKRVL